MDKPADVSISSSSGHPARTPMPLNKRTARTPPKHDLLGAHQHRIQGHCIIGQGEGRSCQGSDGATSPHLQNELGTRHQATPPCMSALAETRNAVLTHLDAEFQRRLVHVRNCQKRQVVRHLATDHPCKSGMCMRPSKSMTSSSMTFNVPRNVQARWHKTCSGAPANFHAPPHKRSHQNRCDNSARQSP